MVFPPPMLIAARHSFHGLSFVTLISCSASGLEQNLPSLIYLLKAEVDLATTGLPHMSEVLFLAWILQIQKQELK